VCKPSCADLPQAPTNKKKQIKDKSKKFTSINVKYTLLNKGTNVKIIEKSKVLNV